MKFGKYVLEKQLAIGGMAEIFVAEQHGPAGFAKTLCIKKILPTYANDATFIEMFLDEARTAAKLSHPNIVQIFELGEIDGSYYIAMEYIKGASLSKIIRKLKDNGLHLPLHYAAKIIANVCSGLDYAHSFVDPATSEPLHLVHRDISPDNVLVSFTGAIKMIDFGIAKAVTNTSQTQAGAVKGKFSYMSPEQVMGRPLDGRSDLFSLGIVLYELTTLRKPFGDDADLMTVSAIVHDPPQEPRKVIAEYPPQLESLLMKALEKDRNQRFVSAQEMQHVLERFIHEQGEFLSDRDIGNYVTRLFSGSADDIETLRNLGSGVRMKLTGMPRVAPEEELAHRQVEIIDKIRSKLVSGETDAPKVTESADSSVAVRTPVRVGNGPDQDTAKNDQPVDSNGKNTDAFASTTKAPGETTDAGVSGIQPTAKTGVGVWLAVVVVIALLGGGGYFLWSRYWQQPPHGTETPTKTGPIVQSPTTTINGLPNVPTPATDVVVTSANNVGKTSGDVVSGDTTTPIVASNDVSNGQPAATDVVVTNQPAMDTHPEVQPTPTTTSAETMGTIQVQATPTMKVYDGDNFKGTSPISFEVPPGHRTLKLFAPDGTKLTHNVDVVVGKTAIVNAKLTEGTLIFADLAPGIEVIVDNRRIGKTPLPDQPAWQGQHEIKLIHPSGKTRTIPVVISEIARQHRITAQW